MRCLYVDLDGTLLGPDASLLRGADGAFALDGVRALQACSGPDVEVVLFSGRRQQSVFEARRLIGSSSYIFELGCGLVLDGELEWLTDGLEPSESAARSSTRSRPRARRRCCSSAIPTGSSTTRPWSVGREVSHLFRGDVDLDEVAARAGTSRPRTGCGWSTTA